jgi:YegS/Rv2252/BmrU family lipid kinase
LSPPIVVIVNPTSGPPARRLGARGRAEQAASTAAALGVSVEVVVTHGPGHGRELARAALARGVRHVVAWGGDGTINEVGSAVAFGHATLGIVPVGSGNGLARDLGVPLATEEAVRVSLRGVTRTIDAGDVNGRLFFNVAGVGLDARVAHRFAELGRRSRGLWTYVRAATREMLATRADDLTIDLGGGPRVVRTTLVAIANSRQYGNGALIAPRAQLDDGWLDVVVVGEMPLWRLAAGVPALFSGRLDRHPRVHSERARELRLCSSRPVVCHVDGEPAGEETSLTFRVRPGAVTVAVPPAH